MRITWNRNDDFLTIDRDGSTRIMRCWCKVRNELNGLRPLSGRSDVVRTETKTGADGVPHMPRPFPLGSWRVERIIPHPDKVKDSYLYPFFIATNAWQIVDEWELDERGYYRRPSGRTVPDYGYGIHFSSSYTTLGCLRIGELQDLIDLAGMVREELDAGREVPFEVKI